MHISVIMPVLNGERFLRDALASVDAQTYAPFEVIIVDGPSTDNTASIARSFAPAQYFRQTGTGLWSGLNEAIKVARGNAIAFLSADDLWDVDKLFLQNAWLEEHPETSCVFSQVQYLAMEEGSPLFESKPEIFGRPYPGYLTENMLARREVFDRLGEFPVQYRISSDIDWFGRLIDSEETSHVLPQVLLTKRFHGKNLSTEPAFGAVYNRELLRIVRGRVLAKRGTVHEK